MDSISINIGGDLFLGRRIEQIAMAEPEQLFDQKILDIFSLGDLNILNLESPLTNVQEEHRLIKTGPNLKASRDTVKVLNELKINLVTLANNHIYDYGDQGLSDTLELIRKNNIATVGAGLTLYEAEKIFTTKIKEITISVVNITENEWSTANENHGGANPMNIISNTRSIARAKSISDVVILVIHGGHEFYHYPSPRMVEQYRFYAEQGASMIVSHHSHCISGYEIYKNVPIFYGLGNFLFDSKTDFTGWYEGIFLNVEINFKKEISWKICPFKQCKNKLKVEILEGQDKIEVENKIMDINQIIAEPRLLKEKFNLFVYNQKNYVLSIFSTSYILKSKFLRSVIRKTGLEHFFLRRAQLKSFLNYSRCEALRDVSIKLLLDYITRK